MFLYTCNWKIGLGEKLHSVELGGFGSAATETRSMGYALRSGVDYKGCERVA
jgi:hypothetical protein